MTNTPPQTPEVQEMSKSDAKKIDEALSLLNEVAQDKKKELREMITDRYGNLKKAILDVETEVAQGAKHGAERIGEYRQAATDQVKDTAHRVDTVVHSDPWKALGWAVAGAFTLGYLFGHKSKTDR